MLLWGPWTLDDLERPEALVRERQWSDLLAMLPLEKGGVANWKAHRRDLTARLERDTAAPEPDGAAVVEQFLADMRAAATRDGPRNRRVN